jgi:acetyltransferase-like isoleucine patch superfamily enzyme
MRVQLIKALAISVMPSSGLRRSLYNWVCGYDLSPTTNIGFLTLIAVKSLKTGDHVQIGMLNIFKGPIEATIGSHTRIGRQNTFSSSWDILSPKRAHMGYKPVLQLGEGCLVLHKHFIDIYGRFEVGDGSWIAGHGSQFWTHGISAMDRDIVIGKGNYIGTGVKFAPGARIGNSNVVGLGSVVSGKIDADQSLISGFPAKVIRSIADDLAAGKYRFSFEDWGA